MNMKNPFISAKFLKATGLEYINELLGEHWWKLPPISAEIDLSNICNHACIWCYFEPFKQLAPVEMPTDILKESIIELGDMDCKSVTFTGGGEPFCHTEAFPDALYWVVENRMKIGIVTNGELIDPYIEDIANTSSFIRFSVDAATATTYELLHKSKNFNTVINNIRNITTKDLDVGMAFLVHPGNYREAGAFLKLGDSLGVDYVEYRPAYLLNYRVSSINRVVTQDVIKQIKEARAGTNVNVFVRMGRFQDHLEEELGFSECIATPLVVSIGSDSIVYTCCQHWGNPEFALGSLEKNSIKEIWYSDQRKQVAENIDISKCTPCRFKGYNKLLTDLRECTHEEFL